MCTTQNQNAYIKVKLKHLPIATAILVKVLLIRLFRIEVRGMRDYLTIITRVKVW